VAATDSWRFPQKVDHPDGTSQQVIQQWSGDLATLEKEFRSSGDTENDVNFGVGSAVGNFLIGGDEYSGHAVIFDVKDEREIDRTPRSRDQLHCLDVSPNDERVALGFRNGLVECFSIDRDRQGGPRWSPRPRVFRACDGNLFDVKFVDGNTLVTAGPDGLVRVWHVDVDRSLIERLPRGELLEMAVSPTGQAIVCCHADGVFVIDGVTGRTISRLPIAKGSAPRAVWSPSGRRIAVWANEASAPVRVYDQNGRLACEGPPPSKESRVAISPDDKTLALFQSELRLVDLQTGEPLWETPLPEEGPPGWQAVFSHDGRTLAYSGRESAFGGHKPQLVLLDVQQRRKLLELPVEEDVACMAFSPDDSTLATGHGDSLLRIWDLRTGRLLKKLAGHAGVVRHVAFAPGGDRLITDSDDGTARLWSIRHGRSFGLLPHPHHARDSIQESPASVGISLSSDGSRVALSTLGEDGRPVLAVVDVEVPSAL
jgi:WD40 repeat protein